MKYASELFGLREKSSDENEVVLQEIIATHHNSLYERIICQNLLSGINNVEVIRNSLLTSSEQLKKEEEIIEKLNEKNLQARNFIHALLDKMCEFEKHAENGNEVSRTLQASVEDIRECVSDINRLANQTDLLAINSAIEAARVGTMGRGFTVLSKEVKCLAEEVKNQSAKIEKITNDIKKSADQVSDNGTTVIRAHVIVRQEVNEACEALEEVIKRSARMQSVIRFISRQQFLNTVKLDHIVWKQQVYSLLFNKDKKGKVNTHHECRLGKWYYEGEGHALFVGNEKFRQLERPHAEVHNSGRAALTAFCQNDVTAMADFLEKIEQASSQVILIIDCLIEQIAPDYIA
ncbi:methyl-accepting chemotaxis protein [Pantoea alhagi]|uniref:methyl-accepting chemotaxis protein n=1 Tax=Pantoea alhagi TaxID=1891675 RepID=UPI000A150E82|nr:methyl-accepting chemotaxis protein [Pantoea alhagi]